jgi:hypothetical protein
MLERTISSIAGSKGLQITIAGSFVWHVMMVLMFSSVVQVDAGTSDARTDTVITYTVAPMRPRALLVSKEWVPETPPATKEPIKIQLPVRTVSDRVVYEPGRDILQDNASAIVKVGTGDIEIEPDMLADLPGAGVSRPLRVKQALSVNKTKLFSLDGREATRRIVWEPALPLYPAWAEKQGREFVLKLKLLVTADGIIETVQVLRSSGSVEIDDISARHMRGLRLEKIEFPKESKWYIRDFKFELTDRE